jgi:hypothetical protein
MTESLDEQRDPDARRWVESVGGSLIVMVDHGSCDSSYFSTPDYLADEERYFDHFERICTDRLPDGPVAGSEQVLTSKGWLPELESCGESPLHIEPKQTL